jgi:quinol monooxygenase YgiN
MTTLSDNAITLLFSYRVHDEDRFQSYLDKVLPVTEADEPYMLAYEIFQNEAGVYMQREVYADGDALAKHFDLTADGQKDFAAATEVLSLTALGAPPAEWFTIHHIPTDAAFAKIRAISR